MLYSCSFKVHLPAHENGCQFRSVLVAAVPLAGVVGGRAFAGKTR